MLLNLNDPASIVAWWQVLPDQHDVYLDHKMKVSPEFGPAISEAQRRISGDPRLLELRARAAQQRRYGHVIRAESRSDSASPESRRSELAAA
ncbi:MAG: hypothetical protein EON59_05745 [Alphaproteobacteria bacterium]|nr:MAG: hypothetical protein EON59_05745 [Alphaproteobacteria bacterium]